MRLLDTNTVVHFLKGRDRVVAHMQNVSRQDVGLPSVVAYELNYGALKSSSGQRRSVMTLLLRELTQAPFDAPAALEAARIRVKLEQRGLVIGPLDLMIAGTALSIGAILVTNNTREFSRVEGLRLEDWTT